MLRKRCSILNAPHRRWWAFAGYPRQARIQDLRSMLNDRNHVYLYALLLPTFTLRWPKPPVAVNIGAGHEPSAGVSATNTARVLHHPK